MLSARIIFYVKLQFSYKIISKALSLRISPLHGGGSKLKGPLFVHLTWSVTPPSWKYKGLKSNKKGTHGGLGKLKYHNCGIYAVTTLAQYHNHDVCLAMCGMTWPWKRSIIVLLVNHDVGRQCIKAIGVSS